jgi:hypothetical protein
MAIDALRLRSVIQLFGILSTSCVLLVFSFLTHVSLVFHVTLLVFAAIQVTQTHMALTGLTDCDATVSYAVRQDRPSGIASADRALPVVRRDSVQEGFTVPYWCVQAQERVLTMF